MAALPDLAEWVVDANDALSLSLVSPSKSGLRLVGSFHPNFTYPIFGEEEKIFGYKDLKISLRFRANDMRPHLETTYRKKLSPPAGVEEPTDIKAVFQEGNHLPKVAFVKSSDFEDSSQQLGDKWTPPGTLQETIDGPDGQYEIWRGSLEDPAIKQLNSRIQILVPLFIEGGSYIGQNPESDSPELDLSDANRWTVFFLYRTQKSDEQPDQKLYVFVGYSTVYRFFYFGRPLAPPPESGDEWELPDGNFDLAKLPCRTRLSQFIILPPFQGKGNGAKLYKSIFQYYHKHKQTHEFTVENPNEAFDDLRDVCDLTFLKTIPDFVSLKLDPSVTIPKKGPVPSLVVGGDRLEEIRLTAKIAPRQFHRMVEMYLMSQLPSSVRPSMALDDDPPVPIQADKHLERLWQLLVKKRLYRHNREALSQIEQSERIDKLQETLTGVELEYARILAAQERASGHSPVPSQTSGKRKIDDKSGDESQSKKPRVEDA
ncbi:Histone acetyltransferase type B, catalytic subunit [Metarhizium album ARSEF 1941]|uniref:Histone acetyltransferase type B catalytic subunit n=1 Tax=Metarhizium album (strain ARSEF 1941) TaxID=1081103 RepID=A0A0B2WZQ4_METAS|nr:Histone acetyltransferase type B, catalytic subunit [Metarhizium album ARSEF 1941]KHN99538.1 Histone acetyltransferase type B, catalytic subunit [Metarhizium album ARSEF 1941]